LLVRKVFAGAGDRHLDQHGGDGGDDRHRQRTDESATPLVVVAPSRAQDRSPLEHASQHGYGAGKGGGDGGDKDIPVADMGELVGHYPLKLIRGKDAQNPVGGGYCSVGGISPGGEGVGALGRDDVDPRHGEAGLQRKPAHHAVKGGMVVLADFAGAVHLEDDLVGKPVGEEIHGQGHEKGEEHAALAADGAPHDDHQHGEEGEEKGCLDQVHCFASDDTGCRRGQ